MTAIFAAAVAMSISIPTAAQVVSSDLVFESLTTAQGLSQNTVQCVAQDSAGYMWFGTLDGLNRYDGYSFDAYYHDPFDSTSLPSSNIISMHVDHEGTLWVGTIKALTRVIPKSDGTFYFKRYPFVALTFFEDENKELWVGTKKGIVRYDGARDEMIPFHIRGIQKNRLWVFSVFNSSDIGFFWGAENSCVYRVRSIARDVLSVSPLSKENGLFLCDRFKNAKQIIKGPLGSLWFISEQDGIIRLGPTNDFTQPDDNISKTFNRNAGMILRYVLVDDRKEIWIATNGNGLFRWNPKTDRLLNYRHEPGNAYSLSSDYTLFLYRDSFGMIWVGTNGGGVCKFDPSSLQFKHVSQNSNHENSLPGSKVWAFYQDRENSIWIGTDKGLTKMIRGPNTKTSFKRIELRPAKSKNNLNPPLQVRAVCEDENGNLWIGTLRNGLIKYHLKTGQKTYFIHDPADPNSLPMNFVYALQLDAKQRLWVGTNAGGLTYLDLETERFHHKTLWHKFPDLDSLWVLTLYEDSSKHLWIGTWQNGLFEYDKTNDRLKRYQARPGARKGLTANTILSIHEDRKGNFWIGTYGGGLNRLDPKSGRVESITMRNGLPDNVIYGILEDDAGDLWLSTNHGLARYAPETKRCWHYDRRDGLETTEFNLGAYYRTRDGEFFFGGVDGFYYFYPRVVINSVPPRLQWTGLKKFGYSVASGKPLSCLQAVILSYKDRNIGFKFTALHFKDPLKNRYAYKLTDENWTDLGYKREVNFHNLPPGEYALRVRAANSDGVWNKQGLSIHILVQAPFWRQEWFIALFLIMIALAAYIFHRRRIRGALELERIRSEERERTRRQLTFDLHDHLGAQVTKISTIAEILLAQTRTVPKQATYLRKIVKYSRDLYQDLRGVLWLMNPEKDSVYDLLLHLAKVGDELFEPTDIRFQVHGLEEAYRSYRLNVEDKENLRCIFTEAMTNVLKHARSCTEVHLRASIHDNLLHMSLCDDGAGFHVGKKYDGTGLRSLKQRANELGAELKIESSIGKGTCVQIVLKLPIRVVA